MNSLTPPMKTKEPRTQIEARTGVSRQTLSKWEKQGVDIWNEDELQSKIGAMRGAGEETGGDGGGDQSDAAKLLKAKAEKEFHSARIQKIKADAEEGKYVTRESQLSVGHQAGLLVRAELQKMASELPPILAGLESGQMAAVIEDYGWNKAEHLSKAFGELGVTDGGGAGGGMPTPEAVAPKRVGRKKRPPPK
mgnify:CR=1 FL=1